MTTNKQWYRKSGPEGDVVISTRIRLARKGHPRQKPRHRQLPRQHGR